MKLKTIIAALGFSLMAHASAHAQQVDVIDISTGVQPNGTFFAFGALDPQWTITYPNGNVVTPFVCSPGNVPWVTNTCSRWLSPEIYYTNFPKVVPAGTYKYNVTFNYSGDLCALRSAVLNLNQIAGDNNITGLRINNHVYTINAPAADDFYAMIFHAPININLAHLVQGTNTISIYVQTTEVVVGLTLCGNVTITRAGDLDPTITGPTNFCAGAPLTFTGSDGIGMASSHIWESVECNSNGVPIGSVIEINQLSGSPSTYTFPFGASYTCGKYYRIRLFLEDACEDMEEITKVIFIACPPAINAGPNVTICEGDCITIGTAGSGKVSYSWTTIVNGSTVVVGTTPQITVCPTQTTTYTLSVTSVLGCTNIDPVTVTVQQNNPIFSLSNNTTLSSHYTLSAVPVVVPSGFTWILEELDGAGNALCTISGPGLWNTVNTAFPGFDDVANNYTGTFTTLPASPAQGKFLYNKTYRVTHGTWTSACPWEQFSQTVSVIKSLNGPGNLIIFEDKTAPDFSYLVNSATQMLSFNEPATPNLLRVYPNPTSDRFTLEWEGTSAAHVEVWDMFGKKVKDIPQAAAHSSVDISGFAKGIYLIHIEVDGVKHSQKIVLQ